MCTNYFGKSFSFDLFFVGGGAAVVAVVRISIRRKEVITCSFDESDAHLFSLLEAETLCIDLRSFASFCFSVYSGIVNALA